MHSSLRRRPLLFLSGIALFLIVFAAVVFSPAQAFSTQSLQGPSFQAGLNKDFSPISISAGGVSRLSVTVYNPNPFEMILSSAPAAWTDQLPVGMRFASPANAATTCGGTVTTGGTTLTLIGGAVPAQVNSAPGYCTVSVDVTSSQPGNLINTIPAGNLMAADPTGEIAITNPTDASATLMVNAVQPPSLSKTFAPNTIWVAQTSTLTITLRNNDTNTALAQVFVTDTLPNHITIASPDNAATTCGSGTVSTTAASVTLSGGTVPAGGTCTVKVSVTSVTPGVYTNVIPTGAIQSQQGVTNTGAATAPLNVQEIGLTKSFSPNNFQVGGSSTLTIGLQNPSPLPYTGVALTDTLPDGLMIASPANEATTCPGGSVSVTGSSVTLTGSVIPAGTPTTPGYCTITVRVTSATSASYTNRIPAGALVTDQGATNVLPATANVSVYGVGLGLGGSKGFNPSSIPVGGDATLTINIIAPADTALTNFSVVDSLPVGVRVSNTPAATKNNNCQGGTFTPAAGEVLLRYSGGTIPVGATCRLTVHVTSDVPDVYTNTISAANISNDQNRNLGTNLTAKLTVSGLTVAKVFEPDTVNPEGLSTLTITLTNTNPNQLDNASMTDTLPGTLTQGVVIAPTPNASTTCYGGSVTANPGTQTISLSNGVIPAKVGAVPGICTVVVDVVGKGPQQQYTNTIPAGDVSGVIHNTGISISSPAAATAKLRVLNITIGVVKGFSPLTVFAGSASTLTVTLSNPNSVPLYGIAFTDNLPQRAPDGGVTVANPPLLSTGTCGGVLTAAPGDTSFSFSGGHLAASASCSLTISTTMDVENNLTNTISIGAVTTTNGAANTQAASATLTNLPGASVSKWFGPNPILVGPGSFSTLSVKIQNVSNFPLTGMSVTDSLPAGLSVAAAPAATQCGGQVTATANSISLTGGSLSAYSSCVLTVDVTAASAGSYQNCISEGALTTDQSATNEASACDTLVVNNPLAPPTIAKSFSPKSIPAGGVSVLTFTLSNPASNPLALTGAEFTDTFPAGLTLASVPNAVQCGGVVTSTASSISLTGGIIPASGSCTVKANVTGAAGGNYYNTTGSVSATYGGVGNTDSDNLVVVDPPGIEKYFIPDSISVGSTSILQIYVTNPNPNVILTGVGFSDVFPTGMVAVGTPATLNGCDASSSPAFTFGPGNASISLSGASIAGGQSCLVALNVTAAGGSYVNTTGAATSVNGGTGATATATLTVTGPGLSLDKSTPTLAYHQAGELLEYQYQLTNTGDEVLYAPFQVIDSRLGIFDCSSGVMSAGSSVLCWKNDTVQAADLTAGSVTNFATATATDFFGRTITSNEDSVTIQHAALTILKRTSTSGFRSAGNTISYTYTLTNTGGVTLYGSGPNGEFMVSDDKIGSPAGTPFVCSATVNSLEPGANVACTGAQVYAVTAADVTAGLVTNTASAVAANQAGGVGIVQSNDSSVTVYLVAPPAISKAFADPSIPAGGSTTMTITLTNPPANIVPLIGVGFLDNFPAGLTVAAAPEAAQCGGAVSSTATSIRLTGGTILPNSACTVSVSVTASEAGVYVNTSNAVTSTNGGNGVKSNPATLVVINPPAIAKKFSPNEVLLGGTSTITFTITNPNADQALFGVGFNDNLPTGMVTANPTNAVTDCGPASFAPAAGAASLSFTGGSIAPGASCIVQVDVFATVAGIWPNTTGPVVSDQGGVGTTSNTAVLTVAYPTLLLDKVIHSGDPYSAIGGEIVYDYILTNTGNVTLIGNGPGGLFTITDDQIGSPKGTAFNCPATPTGLAPDQSVTCVASYSVILADLDRGSVTNQAVGHGLYKGMTVNSNGASQRATATQSPALTLAKSIQAGGSYDHAGDTVTYSYKLTNSGNVTLTGSGAGGVFTITDDHIGSPVGAAFDCGTATSLAPGGSVSCTASYTITQADVDAGSVTNLAAGHSKFGVNAVDSNDHTQTAYAVQAPDLLLEKTITGGSPYRAAGDVINYSYNLTNNGNVTLTGSGVGGVFTITDDHIGSPVGAAFDCGTATSLAPGGSVSCTASYTITTADVTAESVINQASGHGLFAITPVDSNTDQATAVVMPGAIVGVVYNDADKNLTRESSEVGLASVTISLYDSAGVNLLDTTTTDSTGSFTFPNVAPRTYWVMETDPSGYASTTTNGVQVTVPPGDIAQAEYGDALITVSKRNTIQGIVYVDADSSGSHDTGEALLAGVTVTLYDQNGNVAGAIITGADGSYLFTDLASGIYTVTETNLTGYASTTLDTVGVVLSGGMKARVDYGDLLGLPAIVDPAVTKFGSPKTAKIGDIVLFTITVGNNGSADALNVTLTDTLPKFLDIISVDIQPDLLLPVTINGNIITIDFGTVTPADTYTITVMTRVNKYGRAPGGDNIVAIQTTSELEPVANDRDSAHVTIAELPTGSELPKTGFAPGVVTLLGDDSASGYDEDSGVRIEIPTLGVNTTVVGIPASENAWDVSWLGSRLGYLEGTAFPTWAGNSVITGHVTGSNGLPGPLINLQSMKWGDKLIVYAFGQRDVYEVRSVYTTGTVDPSIFQHEDLPWITLVTCKDFDQKTNTYLGRLVVKAVLVETQAE